MSQVIILEQDAYGTRVDQVIPHEIPFLPRIGEGVRLTTGRRREVVATVYNVVHDFQRQQINVYAEVKE